LIHWNRGYRDDDRFDFLKLNHAGASIVEELYPNLKPASIHGGRQFILHPNIGIARELSFEREHSSILEDVRMIGSNGDSYLGVGGVGEHQIRSSEIFATRGTILIPVDIIVASDFGAGVICATLLLVNLLVTCGNYKLRSEVVCLPIA
jgi:hypothetical protein